MTNLGMPKIQAMLFSILGLIDEPSEETMLLMNELKTGKFDPKSPNIPDTLKKFLMHVAAK